MFRHLRNKILFSYFLVLLLCFAVVLVTTSLFIRRTYFSYAIQDLSDDAGLFIDELTKEAIIARDQALLKKVLAKAEDNYTIDILDTSGVLLASSRTRPDYAAQDGLGGDEYKIIPSRGYGYSLREADDAVKTIYVVKPAEKEGTRIGFVRISTPLIYVEKAISRLNLYVVIIFALAMAVSSLLSFVLSRNLSSPLLEMARVAGEVSAGNLQSRVAIKNRQDEIGLLARAFNEMIEKLKYVREERKNILSNISHELLTPITNIRGFAETLYEGRIKDKKDAEECLEVIKRESDYLEGLIEELRLLSRLDSLSMRYEFLPVQASEVILEAEKSLSLKMQAKGIKIRNDFMDGCPQVAADYNALRQVFINLLDNAAKYSHSNQEVRVSIKKEDKLLKISVADKGIGIASKNQEKIFERFYRIDDSGRSEKGLGLGLAIVKEILSSHHALIEVRSSPGQGAEFTVSLPLT